MESWIEPERGCLVCRHKMGRGGKYPRLADHDERNSTLYPCPFCKTYWESGERYLAVISEADARERFPQAFPTPTLGQYLATQLRRFLGSA